MLNDVKQIWRKCRQLQKLNGAKAVHCTLKLIKQRYSRASYVTGAERMI